MLKKCFSPEKKRAIRLREWQLVDEHAGECLTGHIDPLKKAPGSEKNASRFGDEAIHQSACASTGALLEHGDPGRSEILPNEFGHPA